MLLLQMNEMKKHNHNIPEKMFSAHPTSNTTYAYHQAALKQSATGSGGRISVRGHG